MGRRAFLATFMLAGAAHADDAEDFNAFVPVLAIPVYAHNCEIMMDKDVLDTINADVVREMALTGVAEEKGVEIQTQMIEELAANADCTEGSSDRTNFEAALQSYAGN